MKIMFYKNGESQRYIPEKTIMSDFIQLKGYRARKWKANIKAAICNIPCQE